VDLVPERWHFLSRHKPHLNDTMEGTHAGHSLRQLLGSWRRACALPQCWATSEEELCRVHLSLNQRPCRQKHLEAFFGHPLASEADAEGLFWRRRRRSPDLRIDSVRKYYCPVQRNEDMSCEPKIP
jgi:hypothetical protein